jgi:hypothetical protein
MSSFEARERRGKRGEHVGLAVERHEDGVERQFGIRNALPGRFRRCPAQQIVGGEDAKRDHRQEDENERKRKRAEGGLCLEDEREPKARDEQEERDALPDGEACFGAPVRKARMEAVDRSGRKVSRKMAADRLPQRIGRGERQAMRRKTGKHLLDRVRPQFLWREDIGAFSRAVLEQAAGKTFARTLQ